MNMFKWSSKGMFSFSSHTDHYEENFLISFQSHIEAFLKWDVSRLISVFFLIAVSPLKQFLLLSGDVSSFFKNKY